MQIGRKAFPVGATIRYEVDYQYFLEAGRSLASTGFTAAVITPDPGSLLPVTDVIISNVSVTSDKLYFFVAGGSVYETFTVQVQIMDTLGEVIVDTIAFNCIPQ